MFSSLLHQEAYSVARQFNLIPPVCEQAEYHYFQRDKVEVQLPELYHKIGQSPLLPTCSEFLPNVISFHFIYMWDSLRGRSHDLVSACLWINHREVQRRSAGVLQSSDEGQSDLTSSPPGFIPLQIGPGVTLPPDQWEISAFLHFLHLKGYQWLKERVNSEEGRRQLIKIKELHLLADRLSCTAAQLAIGMTHTEQTCEGQAIPDAKRAFDPFSTLQIYFFPLFLFFYFSLVSAQ